MKLLRAFLEGKISENQKNEGKVKKLIAGRGNDLMVFKLCINCFNYAAFFGWKSSSSLRKRKKNRANKIKRKRRKKLAFNCRLFRSLYSAKNARKNLCKEKNELFLGKVFGQRKWTNKSAFKWTNQAISQTHKNHNLCHDKAANCCLIAWERWEEKL